MICSVVFMVDCVKRKPHVDKKSRHETCGCQLTFMLESSYFHILIYNARVFHHREVRLLMTQIGIIYLKSDIIYVYTYTMM